MWYLKGGQLANQIDCASGVVYLFSSPVFVVLFGLVRNRVCIEFKYPLKDSVTGGFCLI